MRVTKLNIPDLLLIEPDVYKDTRGFFFELYNKFEFKKYSLGMDFVQDNISISSKGVIRGLHLQISPFQQSKLISVLEGEIYDVAVDYRKQSPTYLKFVSIKLSSKNKKQVFIPKGFLHGFQVLSKNAVVYYKTDKKYSPKHERIIRHDNKKIGIKWPLENIHISKKDIKGKNL